MNTKEQSLIDAMAALLGDAELRLAKAADDIKRMADLLQVLRRRQALAEAKAKEIKGKAMAKGVDL